MIRQVLARHYRLTEITISESQATVENLATRLQCRCQGKNKAEIDFRRLLEHLLRDFPKGRLGYLSLEQLGK